MPSATSTQQPTPQASLWRFILLLTLPLMFSIVYHGRDGEAENTRTENSLVDSRWSSVDIPPAKPSPGERNQKPPLEPLSVFVLMGKSGVGKSSFIKSLGGRDLSGNAPIVDGGIHSVTQVPAVYVTTVGEKAVMLLDTPGFDDSARDNLEILREIISELFTLARNAPNIEMQGVILLHDIRETRFGGSQKKTLEILKALVGKKNLRNVIVGTTNWSPMGSETFQRERERELSLEYEEWKGIPKTMRVFLRDKNSAVRIIEELFTQPPFLMLAQEEMLVAPHAIEDTTAAKLVMPEGYSEMERIKKEKEKLKRKVGEYKRLRETAALRQEIDELRESDRRLEEKVDDLAKSIKSMAERGPRDGWFEESIRVFLGFFRGEFSARKIVAWFNAGVYLAERPIYA